jgi:hypothetical protein
MPTTATCAASRSTLPPATPAAYRAVMELAIVLLTDVAKRGGTANV